MLFSFQIRKPAHSLVVLKRVVISAIRWLFALYTHYVNLDPIQ